jgi:hypothetical protein
MTHFLKYASMNKMQRSCCFALAISLSLFAALSVLKLMVRTDTIAELWAKRVDACLVVFLWPLAFAAFMAGAGQQWRRIFSWGLVVLFLSWVIAVGAMHLEYSRLYEPDIYRGPFGI